MNFINQLKGFKAARMQRPIGTNAIVLFFVLLETANEADFPEALSIGNLTLQGITDLCESSFMRARNELIQKGYIEYRKGTRGQKPVYVIRYFDECSDTNSDLPLNLTANWGLSERLSECYPDGNVNAIRTVEQEEKEKKEKKQKKEEKEKNIYNNNNDNVRTHEENPYQCYEENIGFLSPFITDAIKSYLDDGVDGDVICAAIKQAVENGVLKWRYVEKILIDKLNRGIKTLSAYKADEAAWERKKTGKQSDSPPTRSGKEEFDPSHVPIARLMSKYREGRR